MRERERERLLTGGSNTRGDTTTKTIPSPTGDPLILLVRMIFAPTASLSRRLLPFLSLTIITGRSSEESLNPQGWEQRKSGFFLLLQLPVWVFLILAGLEGPKGRILTLTAAMGNCWTASSRVDSAHGGAADPSNVNSRAGLSFPSTRTSSTARSSLSVPSYSGKSTGESLPTPKTECEILLSSNLKAFTFNELKSATRNFRPDSLLGEGGFGYVYKGWIDEHTLSASRPGSGMVVAVKKLKPEGFQGHKEWLTEVQYLGQLHHPNLVKLIGYCSEGDNRLLVYEFMPKGSLENHLFRRVAQPLSWATRIKVAVEAARGLSFLHDLETQVIYRDVKASNILLDVEFNAKLSDFGLAKDGPTGDRTHVSTQVMGTHGYAAPEYIATGRLSVKADVYSFGVVLLELLSGRRAVDKSKVGIEQNLVDWARPYLGDKRKLFRVMDTRLEGQYAKKGASTVASVALQCLGKEAKLRPRMSEVLAILEQLQDSKETAKTTSQMEQRNVSSHVPKSSTLRPLPGGSPLPPQRRSPRVR